VTEMAPFFSGAELWGDDFSEPKILEWFADEEDGYAQLCPLDRNGESVGY
jgi:hypothetical protein